MKKISGILIVLVLALSIFTGCGKTEDIKSPTYENNIFSEKTSENAVTKEIQSSEEDLPSVEKDDKNLSENNQTSQNFTQGKTDNSQSSNSDNKDSQQDSNSDNKNSQQNSNADDKTVQDKDQKLYCTVLIDCSTIFDNMDLFDKNKIYILPKDGIILNIKAEYKEGDTVFDVLVREARRHRIHIEYGLDGYVKGIANIYEKDCGGSSGWNYSVNGKFPSRSCKDIKVSENDVIKWLFTCDYGKDIGDTYYS